MSAEGFNSPSWIILVLSSWELHHWKCIEIVNLDRDKDIKLERRGHLMEFSMSNINDAQKPVS